MFNVIIALIPALAVSVYYFGFRVLTMAAVSMAFCVVFEYLYRKLLKKSNTVRDLSACVTGLLLAMCLPVTAPYWVVIIGDFFAIVIVKQLFGGLGKNFMNPALAGRAFLFSFPVIMSTWAASGEWVSIFSTADAVTTATPMASLHSGVLPSESLLQMLAGQHGGSMGEVASAMLILGGIHLIVTKVIRPHIPVAYILTVAVLTFIFPRGNDHLQWMLYNLLGGGLMLGAFFMATDYVTSPVTGRGQIIYGIGCGLVTVLIRYFGSYPEGVSYAILVMNAFSWLIDKAGKPRRFGVAPFASLKAKFSKKEAAK
jgi:electron transport complex protein RnfD